MLAAEDRLKDAGAVRDRDLYDVVLKATGDADAAELAFRRRLAARLEAGQKPDV